MKKRKKQLKREYKKTARVMGVFLIRNIVNNKVLVGVGLDVKGIMNRHKFELEKESHPNHGLQADWNEFGSDNFAFEIVDQLPARADPNADYRPDLASLGELWLEKLQPFDERGYNEHKVSREEMLRRIARKK